MAHGNKKLFGTPASYIKPNKGTCSFKPTPQMRRKVMQMTAVGFPMRMIREHIINPRTKKPVDTLTFQRHFAEELRDADDAMNAAVAEAVYQYATSKNPQAIAAAKFWLTHKAKWAPPVAETEDSGKLTIEIVNKLDV